jgi:hypothetical protein
MRKMHGEGRAVGHGNAMVLESGGREWKTYGRVYKEMARKVQRIENF